MAIALHLLLESIRLDKQLTLEELAQKSQISMEKLRQYELGQKVPSVQTLLKLSSVLEVPVQQFVDCLHVK
jgi:HTH-type transcriptional regulator, competence development regulator